MLNKCICPQTETSKRKVWGRVPVLTFFHNLVRAHQWWKVYHHKDTTTYRRLGYHSRRRFSCDTLDFLYGKGCQLWSAPMWLQSLSYKFFHWSRPHVGVWIAMRSSHNLVWFSNNRLLRLFGEKLGCPYHFQGSERSKLKRIVFSLIIVLVDCDRQMTDIKLHITTISNHTDRGGGTSKHPKIPAGHLVTKTCTLSFRQFQCS